MAESFFLLDADGLNNDMQYAAIRDNPRGAIFKERIENRWKLYKEYAPDHFLKKAQVEFYQRWWEMSLGVGLLNLDITYETNKADEGPDFKIHYCGNGICIEAVAPNPGEPGRPDSVPEKSVGDLYEEIEKPCILRMTNSIRTYP